jgi:DNA-binding NarL/FixJ family response regulator
MTPPTSVIIVDDHPLLRRGLRQAIESDGKFRVVGEAEDGPGAWELIESKKPAVAVVDINLPVMSGLDLARRVQSERRKTAMIMLTMHKEEEMVNLALDVGVKGYIVKDNATQEILLAGLAAVAAGGHYLSPSISGYLVKRRHRAAELAEHKPGLNDLTRAELRILKLIAEKKTTPQIAAELFISPRTVESHRANIISKLQLRGAHSLLQFALENRSSL